MRTKQHIEESVRQNLEAYFNDMEGIKPTDIYDMMLKVVERPLFEVVLKHADNNKSRAAEWLGINRNTLHRKLLDHNLI